MGFNSGFKGLMDYWIP